MVSNTRLVCYGREIIHKRFDSLFLAVFIFSIQLLIKMRILDMTKLVENVPEIELQESIGGGQTISRESSNGKLNI